jgi:probable rRNA maturation factor
MIFVQFDQDLDHRPEHINRALVETAAWAALQQHAETSYPGRSARELADLDLSIVITDDRQLQDLNRQFLAVDRPTDVLAFPSGEMDPDTGSTYLGDVIVSFPQAQKQADAAGHSLEDEIQLLVVHGVLHLLGYDHHDGPGREKMWAVQTGALLSIGLDESVIRSTDRS